LSSLNRTAHKSFSDPSFQMLCNCPWPRADDKPILYEVPKKLLDPSVMQHVCIILHNNITQLMGASYSANADPMYRYNLHSETMSLTPNCLWAINIYQTQLGSLAIRIGTRKNIWSQHFHAAWLRWKCKLLSIVSIK